MEELILSEEDINLIESSGCPRIRGCLNLKEIKCPEHPKRDNCRIELLRRQRFISEGNMVNAMLILTKLIHQDMDPPELAFG